MGKMQAAASEQQSEGGGGGGGVGGGGPPPPPGPSRRAIIEASLVRRHLAQGARGDKEKARKQASASAFSPVQRGGLPEE
jgi:hypothetical protein